MPESTPLARAADVPPGTTHRVERDGEALLVCNVGGAFYAIEDQCTHDGGELDQGELEGCRIMCPRHGAYFDVTSGAALTLDEFALWLNLEDVYWAKQGRESIDAVVLFGSLLSLSVLGKGFFAELLKGAGRA